MHFSTIAFAAVAAVGPLVHAHGAGLPQVMGLDVADVRVRSMLRDISARLATSEADAHEHSIETRQLTTNNECGPGPGKGHCPKGQCCSREGCRSIDEGS